jgi:predicted RNase H-like nuclease (RuvC/YqgF family)
MAMASYEKKCGEKVIEERKKAQISIQK